MMSKFIEDSKHLRNCLGGYAKESRSQIPPKKRKRKKKVNQRKKRKNKTRNVKKNTNS